MICEDLERVTKTKGSRDTGKSVRKRNVEPMPTQLTLEARRERKIDAHVMSMSRRGKGRENKKQNTKNYDRNNPN